MNWWDDGETQLVGTLWPSGATVLDLETAEEVLAAAVSPIPMPPAVWIDRERDRTVVASFVGVEVYALDGTSVLERRASLTPETARHQAGNRRAGLLPHSPATADRLWVTALDFGGRIPIVEWDMTTDPPQMVQELPPFLMYAQGDSTLRFGPDFMEVLGGDHTPIGPPVPTLNAERGQPFIWRASFDGSTHRAAPGRNERGRRLRHRERRTHRRTRLAGRRGGRRRLPHRQTSRSVATATTSCSTGSTPMAPVSFIHDTATGEVVHTFRVDEAGDLPWLGTDTVYSNPPGSFDLERRDIETLEINGPPLVGHTLILNSMIDDPDSDRVVTQATNGNVRVWDRETGQQIGREIAIGRQAAGHRSVRGARRRSRRRDPRHQRGDLELRHRDLARPRLSRGRPQHDPHRVGGLRTPGRALPGDLPRVPTRSLNVANANPWGRIGRQPVSRSQWASLKDWSER